MKLKEKKTAFMHFLIRLYITIILLSEFLLFASHNLFLVCPAPVT
jgi:hypothetical protein